MNQRRYYDENGKPLTWEEPDGSFIISRVLDGFLCGANLPQTQKSVNRFLALSPRPTTWEQAKIEGQKIRKPI
jgi:hypothetical protein